MKDFLDLACERYSVRKYSDKEIEDEKLEKILKAAQVAPTGNNFQPQRVFVLNHPTLKEGGIPEFFFI